MTNATIKSSFAKVLAAGALLSGAMFAGQSALACTVDNWSGTSGAVAAGDPAVDGIARYQGLCGLQATGQGFVQDNNPGGTTPEDGLNRIVARFYVLNGNTEPATIYSGFSVPDGSGELFNVTLDAAGEVTLTDTATGQFVSQVGTTNWLSVEIDWVQGAGSGVISLSVNGLGNVEATGLGNASTNKLSAVRLGNLDGAAGTLGFDSYESRRSTAVGRLVRSDANNDGAVNGLDIVAIRNEALGSGLVAGQPDCNEDGVVNGLDIVCARNIVLGG